MLRMRPSEAELGAAAEDLLHSEGDRYEEGTVIQEAYAHKIDRSSLRPEDEGGPEVAQCEETQVSCEVLHPEC